MIKTANLKKYIYFLKREPNISYFYIKINKNHKNKKQI